MKNSILITVALFLCAGCGSLDDLDTPQPVMDEERSGPSSPKADDANGTACQQDVSTRDGVCEESCRDADPDCADRTLSDEELAFICELEVNGPNGYCIPVCGDLDADCANQEEEEEEDRCARGFEHTDGVCDALCFPEDEDCLAIEDTCDDDYRYADGQCDEDCVFADPDCSTSGPDTSALESWQRETCENLRNFGDLLIELSYSICIESRPSEMPNCAASCIAVYEEAAAQR